MAKDRTPLPLPDEDNAALSFDEWISSLGRAARAGLKGEGGAARRNLEDFALDPIDALLPGNVFKKRTRPGDDINFDELLGGMEPGVARSVINVIGNTLTNPLSILQATPQANILAKGGKGLLTQAERIPAVAAATHGLRRATGNVRKGKRVDEALSTAHGTESAVERAWHDYTKEKLAPYDEATRKVVFDTVQNVNPSKDGFKVMNPEHDSRKRYMRNESQIRDAIERLKKHPDFDKLDPKAAEAALKDIYGISHGMFAQVGRSGAWELPGKVWHNKASGEILNEDEFQGLFNTEQAAKMKEIGVDPQQVIKDQFEQVDFDPETMSARDYLQRSIDVDDLGRKSFADHARKLTTSKELAEFLNDPSNNVTSYERDALKAISTRIPSQGRILRRQTLSDELFGPGLTTGRRPNLDDLGDTGGDGAFKSAVKGDIAAGHMTGEEAEALMTLWDGIGDTKPTGWFSKVLDHGNQRFKQAAVYGIMIPKFAALFRNRLGTFFQSIGAEGVDKKAAWNQLKNAIPDTFASIVHDGFGLKMPKNKLTRYLDMMEEAIHAGGGRSEKAAAYLRAKGEHRLASALELGVVDSGFVSGDKLIEEVNKTKWTTIRDTPERMFQGTEQRARLGLFLDMLDEKGSNAKPVAAKVRDTLYDYSYSSDTNRELRRWLPFAQFTFQAIPREGRKLLRNPAALVAASELYGQDEDAPTPDWIASQAHLNVGNGDFLTGLGMPMDSLTRIPNLTGGNISGTVWDTINQAQPLLKTGIGFVADKDPFTGREFGGSQRLPFASEKSDLGKAYRVVEGSGLVQPLATPVQMAETLTNPKRNKASAAAQVFFGPTIREVDQDRVDRELLELRAAQDPSVHKNTFTSFSADEGADAETMDVIERLRAFQKEAAAAAKKRKQSASEVPPALAGPY